MAPGIGRVKVGPKAHRASRGCDLDAPDARSERAIIEGKAQTETPPLTAIVALVPLFPEEPIV